MDNKYKKLFKDTGLLTISNFASKIIAFFLVPLYTTVLSTEEYGTFDIVYTTIQFLVPILTLNISEAVMRFCLDKGADLKRISKIGFITEAVGFGVFVLAVIGNQICGVIPISNTLSLLIISFYFSYALNDFAIQLAKGFDSVKSLAVSGVIGTISMISLNIILLLVHPLGLYGFFFANIFGQLLPALYIILRTKAYLFSKERTDKVLFKKMIFYSIPLIMNYLAWKINAISDRYVVSLLCGLAANGIYSISYKIPTLINTVQTIFTQAWQISVMQQYTEDNAEEYFKKVFVFVNLGMGFLCGVLIVISKLLARILFAKEFFSAWMYVPFLLISCVVNTASGVIGPILLAEKKTKPVSSSALLGAVVNIVLNIILVYYIGPQGAAIATLLSSIVIFSLRFYYVKSMFYKENPLGIVLVSWCVLIVQGIVQISMSIQIALVIHIFLLCIFLLIYKNFISEAIEFIFRTLHREK